MSSSVTFGSTILTNTSTTYGDIFLVKYDGSGNVVWAKTWGGTSNDQPNAVVTDVAGNIYMAGNYLSTAITFGATTITNSGSGPFSSDIF